MGRTIPSAIIEKIAKLHACKQGNTNMEKMTLYVTTPPAESIYKHICPEGYIQTQNLLLVPHLNSHHLWRCPIPAVPETSPPAPLGATGDTQAPPAAPPPPATWSTALTSALAAPASWAPLSTARRPAVSPSGLRRSVWCPVPARRPAAARGPPRSPVPARRLSLGLWASGPAAAAPWALDTEAATQGAVGPVASDAWALASVASLPWAVDPDSGTQLIFPAEVSIHLATDQPVDLASSDWLVEESNSFEKFRFCTLIICYLNLLHWKVF